MLSNAGTSSSHNSSLSRTVSPRIWPRAALPPLQLRIEAARARGALGANVPPACEAPTSPLLLLMMMMVVLMLFWVLALVGLPLPEGAVGHCHPRRVVAMGVVAAWAAGAVRIARPEGEPCHDA